MQLSTLKREHSKGKQLFLVTVVYSVGRVACDRKW